MRRRRFRRVGLTLLASLLSSSPAFAQRSTEAALFLLLPVGARAVSVGSATTASGGAAESVYWNAAGLALMERTDAVLHHSQSVIGTGDALVVAFARPGLGAFAVAANLLDFDTGPVTGPDTVSLGDSFSRNLALSASIAGSAWRRLRLGVSYKLLQFRFDCTGECPELPGRLRSSSAFDAGVQFDLPTKLPVVVGAAVRNAGPNLRIQGSESSEPLPTRLHVGAEARFELPARVADSTSIRGSIDFVGGLPTPGFLPRAGVELAWERRVFVRGGYIANAEDSDAGGASLGIGFVAGRLAIDFGRSVGGLSADVGQAPTYLSLRLRF